MFARFRLHLLFGLLAFGSAQGWNRWNIHVMMEAQYARYNVRDGRALTATDDASYLTAVDVFLGNRPAESPEVLGDRVDLRAPGYRLWYLLPRLVLPQQQAISVLVMWQCSLYAIAVMLLWETLLAHGLARAIRWSVVLLFALMPMFQGFLFHTLTEGVTPALSLITVCCALLASRSVRWLWLGMGTWALLMVTRPVLAWVGLALLPLLWHHVRSLPRMALIIAIAFAPTAIWWVGNMVKSGHYVGLHPVYRADEPGITRPTHRAFWELAKSWGTRGEDFHPVMEHAFHAAIAGDTSIAYADAFVQLAPPGSLTADQAQRIRNDFIRWQHFNSIALAQAIRSPAGTIAYTTPEEQAIITSLANVTNDWRSDHLFQHHVLVPLDVLRHLVAHSNLNLYLFQYELRGRTWMEALRWLSALLHITLMAAVVANVFLRVPQPLRWCAAGACAYLIYLAYVQRGVEERYTLPVLFIGVVCAAFVLQRIATPNFATARE